ncbi:chemotaxis protein CheA [Enterovibrio coralii]|uniref:Chemotaxis protein CheA n=1 Tax=Enterovibrio coralii TaxID=294935 RepID=A0A135IAG2_9GAMM|nr:chemotaxis protein CheW [Enterovibrio coralii]KXF82443.1 histidine kinase [Enterovibrio coralii]
MTTQSGKAAIEAAITDAMQNLREKGEAHSLCELIEMLRCLSEGVSNSNQAKPHNALSSRMIAMMVDALSVMEEEGLSADSEIVSLALDLLYLLDDEERATQDAEASFRKKVAIITLNKMGMDTVFCEDASIFDDNVQKELDYLISLVGTAEDACSNQPKRKALSRTKQTVERGGEVKSKFEPTTRVKSHLLEQLMSYSEELVQIRNTLFDIAEKQESQSLTELSNKLVSVSDNILNDLLKTQMRPVGNLLNKYRRIVRDLSVELNKKVDVEIVGENIELDSNVIDAINEPLTHLVRNSLDHGFETQEVRASLGKSMVGRLLIHAYNESGKVVISVSDDGKGIDVEKVKEKAVSNGVVSTDVVRTMSDKQALELIFHAGLSTSDKVNAVSGRGVGMDAVKRKVEEIKGSIDVFSEKGVGTEISLVFPLTMATLKVALFDIRGITYAIPSADIASIMGLHKDDAETSVRFDSDHVLLYRNQDVIPLIDPSEYLGELAKDGTFEQAYRSGARVSIVIFRHRGQEWGLPVDEVRAFIDIVIKPLDRSMNGNEVFSGAAVLGNGELALVINLKKVIQLSHTH